MSARMPAAPPPVVRLTIDRIAVHGAPSPSRHALTAAIERAVAERVAGHPGVASGRIEASTTGSIRQPARAGSADAVADAIAVAVARGLGGER